MAGRTGYPAYTDGSSYDPATHMTAIAAHYDDLVGESVATAASLPAADNWAGRLVMAEDTGTLWICTNPAGAGTWRPVTDAVMCLLRKSGNQSLTTSSTPLTWDVEVSDAFAMHSAGNPTRLTAPVAGVYEVMASVYNNNTAGMGTIQARKNGSTDVVGSFQRRDATATAALTLLTSFPVELAAGDYIEIMVMHSTNAGQIPGGTAGGSASVVMKRIGTV